MIRYKVTTLKRKSVTVYNLKHYSLEYQKGKIVEAKPGTLGIFCFESYKEARDFSIDPDDCLILKVRPIGKGIKPNKVSYGETSRQVETYYKCLKNKVTPKYVSLIPKGTICYPKVKVLT